MNRGCTPPGKRGWTERAWSLGGLGVWLLCLAACAPEPPPPETDAEARADIEAYRQQRLADLQAPDGWLSLAGLFWLAEGTHRFGSDPAGDLVFPAGKAPAFLGTLTRTGRTVRVQAAPGQAILHDGTPVDTLTLASDADGPPTVLHHGTLQWYVIERDGRLGLRIKDSELPVRLAFQGVETYPIDLAWRRQARFEPYDPPRTLAIPTVLETDSEQTAPGAVVFDVDGIPYRLDVTGQPGDSTFFVIFGDETNGETTYGGGRYLWVPAPAADGTLRVDFNKAYNPPCVFTPYATCPLPPPQNRLPIRIDAGEKTYHGAD